MTSLRRILIVALRLLAAAVFIYAGGAKFQNPQSFADSIASFRLLPPLLIDPLTLALPPFEVIVGLLLLVGWKVRLAAFVGLVACTIFLMALISAAIRGLPVECGCFGDAHSALPTNLRLWLDIGRDFLLASVLWLIYYGSIPNRPRSDRS